MGHRLIMDSILSSNKALADLNPFRPKSLHDSGANLEFVGEMAINSPFSEEVRHEPEQFMLLRTPQLFQHEWLWYRKALH